MTETETETPGVFTISSVFHTPRERMWAAWTEGEKLKKWFSPKGSTLFHASLDLRPGGLFHYGIRDPKGTEMWGKWMFRDVAAPEKLTYIATFSDPEGGMTRHPFAPGWPLETFSTVAFAEEDGKTTVTVQALPHNATEFERAAFAEGMDSLKQGWTGTFGQLAEYLAQ